MPDNASIIIVDDDPDICETLKHVFEEEGYDVDTAFSGEEALSKLRQRFYNVLLIDVRLPDMKGTALLSQVKAMHPDAVAIIITGYASVDSAVDAFRQKAVDYISKPLVLGDIIATVQRSLEKQRQKWAQEELLAKERQDKELYKSRSIVNGLTELYNYRYFRELLVREIALSHRYSYPLSLLMVDVDDFKAFNDAHGHLIGDSILRCIATSLKQNARSLDVVARYGGEEFAIIMPHVNKYNAALAAERLKHAIETTNWRGMGFDFDPHLTISVGIADYPADAKTDEELISKADQALYAAKNVKNTVRLYGEDD